MCPKYSFSLLLWPQNFPIYLGTLKPEMKLAFPRLPCSYLSSQATELRPLGRKQKCWVWPLRRLLEGAFIPPFLLHVAWSFWTRRYPEDGSSAAKQREGSWIMRDFVERPLEPWTAYFCSSFMWKNSPPCDQWTNAIPHLHTWAPTQPAGTLQAWFPTLAGSSYASSSFSSSSCFSQILWEPRHLKNNSLSWP